MSISATDNAGRITTATVTFGVGQVQRARSGALLFFMGVARREGKDCREVVKLEMESYEKHANKTILEICDEVKKKFKVQLVSIYHLIGEFRIGEPIVLVAVGGPRRENVFSAMKESVKRYKTEPALFKKEVYIDGSHEWVD